MRQGPQRFDGNELSDALRRFLDDKESPVISVDDLWSREIEQEGSRIATRKTRLRLLDVATEETQTVTTYRRSSGRLKRRLVVTSTAVIMMGAAVWALKEVLPLL